ncbi:hypothetical protein [Tsukamurella pseudospumae]|uniref:Uncharacterized protein n=1 Tax=Tsukamurella pseudospumae TaxID=239498 RepID=A0A138AU42_9ACTN|nr:hypothetical protein [Tsukamurella pseudospumae]KXP13933.1 hypothetical protein AXK60_22785 [Tsukamurella pseudospumae]
MTATTTLTTSQQVALDALRWAEMRVESTSHPSRWLDNSYGEDTRALTRAREQARRAFPQGVPDL